MKRNFTIAIILTMLTFACHATTWADDSRDLMEQGRKLTEYEAHVLERQLAENPDIPSAHALLIGYYSHNSFSQDDWANELRHILWMIRNRPKSEVIIHWGGDFRVKKTDPPYVQAKTAWLDHLEKRPNDLQLLRGAARFLQWKDDQLSISLLERGFKLEPSNNEWANRLGESYFYLALSRKTAEKKRKPLMEKALRYTEIDYRSEKNQHFKNRMHSRLAVSAYKSGNLEKSQLYAQRMLSHPTGCAYTNENIYHGHNLLGRIALRQQDVDEARQQLLTAGKKSRCPGFVNTALAKELLQFGETEVVLTYFKHLKKQRGDFDHADIDKWVIAIENGDMPQFRRLHLDHF